MTAYLIATVDDVTDPDKIAEYRTLAGEAMAKHGGKYIARGGGTVFLEGGWEPGRVVIAEFPTSDQAQAFYNSPEYKKAHEVRAGIATFRMLVVEGS